MSSEKGQATETDHAHGDAGHHPQLEVSDRPSDRRYPRPGGRHSAAHELAAVRRIIPDGAVHADPFA
jgi:hypothetical protein